MGDACWWCENALRTVTVFMILLRLQLEGNFRSAEGRVIDWFLVDGGACVRVCVVLQNRPLPRCADNKMEYVERSSFC